MLAHTSFASHGRLLLLIANMLIKIVITLLGDTNEQIKIGAPWGINNSIFRDNAMNERGEAIERLPDSERVGNGGLSLRSVQAMIDACNIGSGHSSPKEQEDVFFVRMLHRLALKNLKRYRVADVNTAAR